MMHVLFLKTLGRSKHLVIFSESLHNHYYRMKILLFLAGVLLTHGTICSTRHISGPPGTEHSIPVLDSYAGKQFFSEVENMKWRNSVYTKFMSCRHVVHFIRYHIITDRTMIFAPVTDYFFQRCPSVFSTQPGAYYGESIITLRSKTLISVLSLCVSG